MAEERKRPETKALLGYSAEKTTWIRSSHAAQTLPILRTASLYLLGENGPVIALCDD